MSGLTPEVVNEMRRLLNNCGDMPNTADFFDLQALLCEHKAALLDAVEERDRLRATKSHMDYCRTLVSLEDGDVLADGIETLKKRVAETDSELKRLYGIDETCRSLGADLHAAMERIAELERKLRDAAPVLRAYAEQNPRSYFHGALQDPHGVNALLEDLEKWLSKGGAK